MLNAIVDIFDKNVRLMIDRQTKDRQTKDKNITENKNKMK
jgi:hypothetical protein